MPSWAARTYYVLKGVGTADKPPKMGGICANKPTENQALHYVHLHT